MMVDRTQEAQRRGSRERWSRGRSLAAALLLACTAITLTATAAAQEGGVLQGSSTLRCLQVAHLTAQYDQAAAEDHARACIAGSGASTSAAPVPLDPRVSAQEMHDIKLAALAHREALARAGTAPFAYAEQMRELKRRARAYMQSHQQRAGFLELATR